MSRSARALLGAQAQAVAVLGTTLDLPGMSLLAHLSRPPRSDDRSLGGAPVTIVRPAGQPPWPTVVFVNGATPDGRTHPMVLRLGLALARTGQLVLIPDLPGIAGGELSPATLTTSVALTHAAADLPETANGRVALAGVSVGASLALLTGADAGLADRVSAVIGVAPYGDLAKVMLLATTGMYRDGDRLAAYPTPRYLGVGLARSLAAILPPTPAVSALYDELRAVDPDSADPLAAFRDRSFDELGDDGVRLFSLLTNRDPGRFDDLYAALPEYVRVTVETLSPLRAAPRLQVPVELATAPQDRYFPVAESEAIVRAAPQARLTVTSLLAHATPRLSPRYLGELGRLNGFFVRALAAAGARDARAVP
jgi:pimeloyl-ACP methyl ester carboxylesterase